LICLQLFLVFFRIGLVSFGGGYAMLPMIFQSVRDFGIMGQTEFARFVALSQATPGPISVNAATYVGFYTAGLPGALAATFAIALPSFIYVLLAIRFMRQFSGSKTLQSALAGIRPATVGLIASAAVFLAESTLFDGNLLSAEWLRQGPAYLNPAECAIFVCALALALKLRLNPVIIILAAAAAGALFM
jgi:chromate transporter